MSNFECPANASDDLRSIVHTLKSATSAGERFHRFIKLSSSHGLVMKENLPFIQSKLITLIDQLLSSFQFKFTTLIDCNGLGQRPGFIEMVHQMDKFCMHDHHHWSLIIEGARKSLDKFSAVNKSKYEDLISFVHLSLDHITRHNIRLDLQSFAILFNIVASSKPTTLGPGLPATLLDLTPLSVLPGRAFTNECRVIKAVDCTTPPGSPASIYSKSCLSTHRRRLNFDALDEEIDANTNTEINTNMYDNINADINSNADDDMVSLHSNQSTISHSTSGQKIQYPSSFKFKLIPLTLFKFKIYERPDGTVNTNQLLKSPIIIPMDLPKHNLLDPRIVNRVVIVRRNVNKRPIQTILPESPISSNTLDSPEMDTQEITSPDREQPDNPNPIKRKRIIWDLD